MAVQLQSECAFVAMPYPVTEERATAPAIRIVIQGDRASEQLPFGPFKNRVSGNYQLRVLAVCG